MRHLDRILIRAVRLAAGCAAALAFAVPVEASGLDRLKAFVSQTQGARAEFSQVVSAKSGRKAQQASGTMMFQRPGKFRWVYEKPYHQLIVGDGEKLWIYDRDLNQVTAKSLPASLGSSPAALLAGDDALEKNFNLQDAGSADGLEWVEATPKSADASFESVRLGFSGDTLEKMELRDTFGQVTTLTFERFERNPELAASVFRFVPPKGADVIGE